MLIAHANYMQTELVIGVNSLNLVPCRAWRVRTQLLSYLLGLLHLNAFSWKATNQFSWLFWWNALLSTASWSSSPFYGRSICSHIIILVSRIKKINLGIFVLKVALKASERFGCIERESHYHAGLQYDSGLRNLWTNWLTIITMVEISRVPNLFE